MLLFRLLLLVVVLFVAYRIYRLIVAPRLRGDSKPPLRGEDMVACAHCAVHVPRHTAIHDGTHWYCCEEHRQRHAEGAPKG